MRGNRDVMAESASPTAISTVEELVRHLADRAMGAAPATGGPRSILDVMSPLFRRAEEIAKGLRAGDGRFTGNAAHDDLEALLSRCERDAEEAGKRDSDIEDAALAVVAWIDESMSAARNVPASEDEVDDRDDPFGDPDAPVDDNQALYRLQTTRFQISDAGERFFERLSALASEQTEAREVYVAALQLGFRGQYFQDDDQGQLEGLKREHAERLLKEAPLPQLATPEPERPARKAAQENGRRRWRMIAAAAVVVAVVGVALAYNWYGGCTGTYGADCTYCTLNPENCFH